MSDAEPLSPKPKLPKRPVFIAVLALLQGISATAAGLAAIMALFGWKGLEGPLGAGADRLAPFTGWGRLAALPVAAIALFCATFGLGLWRLRNWARLLLIGMVVLNVAGDVAVLVLYAAPEGDIAVALTAVLKSVAAVVILRYLTLEEIRGSFR